MKSRTGTKIWPLGGRLASLVTNCLVSAVCNQYKHTHQHQRRRCGHHQEKTKLYFQPPSPPTAHSLHYNMALMENFYQETPNPIPVEQYCDRFNHTMVGVEDSDWVYALVLLDRFLACYPYVALTPYCFHRIWLVLMRIANKMNQDEGYVNTSWAIVGGTSLETLNRCEVVMLHDILWFSDISCIVAPEAFHYYCVALENEYGNNGNNNIISRRVQLQPPPPFVVIAEPVDDVDNTCGGD